VARAVASLREGVSSRYAIAAALKTLDVLFAFEGSQRPLTVTELARRSGTSKNQAYRCLKSLEVAGVVQESPQGFVLTTRLLSLVPAIHRPSFLAVAEPEMVSLREETGETVNLFALAGPRDLVCVATLPTLRAVGLMARVGLRAGLHAGAVPKAVLAALPALQREQVLRELPTLERYTAHTVLDPDRLRAELVETRRRGFSISDQDFEEGARGVGAAILGPDDSPVGGISVGGPISRLDLAWCERVGPRVREAARRIGLRLGSRAH
jgi:DNA-binding IclR family transcriptional regulator